MKMPALASIVLWASFVHGNAYADGAPSRFAIVIGNNKPESSKRVTLRYADDDAYATHELLTEAGVDSVLLVSPDSETASLHDGVAHRPATTSELEAAVVKIVSKVNDIAAHGGRTQLYVFYSGHGDEEEDGEGYVLLEGKRHFTRGMLASLLERIAAHRNLVVIDACKSSLFLFERGPGGEHHPYTGPPLALITPTLRANTGFVLSTSSGRDSHEYERFRGGILSYELRSAMRGAADLDHDGQISFKETRAFLGNANQFIPSPFQLDFHVEPPRDDDDDQALLSWSRPPSIELMRANWTRLYLESARGERLVDLHPAPDRSTFLWLPSSRPIFLRRHDELLEYPITNADSGLRVDFNDARAPSIRTRGASSLAFEELFAFPFVATDLELFGRKPELVRVSPSRKPASHTRVWIAAGSSAVFGAGALTLGMFALSDHRRFNDASCSGICKTDAKASGQTLQLLTNISLGLAGAAAIAAISLFYLESNEQQISTRVSLGPGYLQLDGRM